MNWVTQFIFIDDGTLQFEFVVDEQKIKIPFDDFDEWLKKLLAEAEGGKQIVSNIYPDDDQRRVKIRSAGQSNAPRFVRRVALQSHAEFMIELTHLKSPHTRFSPTEISAQNENRLAGANFKFELNRKFTFVLAARIFSLFLFASFNPTRE